MSKISLTGKRIAMPKLRAATMKDRRTKRNRTRSQQRNNWRKENDC
jgi:hypothetical protein